MHMKLQFPSLALLCGARTRKGSFFSLGCRYYWLVALSHRVSLVMGGPPKSLIERVLTYMNDSPAADLPCVVLMVG